MKKYYYLITAMLLSSVTSFSQLKVNSNGSVRMTGSTSNFSRVYIGDSLPDSYIYKYGLLTALTEPVAADGVGIKGYAKPNNGSYSTSVGVWGDGADAQYTSCGVFGVVTGTGNGAGIYGSTSTYPYPYTNLSGQYAGYFWGETYINGNLTAQNVYTLSDIRLKENVTSLKTKDVGRHTLGQVMDLNVIKYNFKDNGDDNTPFVFSSKEDKKQFHYGLSAQELQTIYPELVKEGQDGFLTVNYVELVPILIRSIQELKEELDEVRGESGSAFRTRSIANGKDNVSPNDGNILYQNKPNPFKEKTTISFQLADGVADATICIFDMTGKVLKKLPVTQSMTSVSLNGYELGEGMFLYTLMVNGQEVDTKRMIITK